jgi:hypothetical protein
MFRLGLAISLITTISLASFGQIPPSYRLTNNMISTISLAFLSSRDPFGQPRLKDPSKVERISFPVPGNRQNVIPVENPPTNVEFAWLYKASRPGRPLVVVVPGFGGTFNSGESIYISQLIQESEDVNVLAVLSPSNLNSILYFSRTRFWSHTPSDVSLLYDQIVMALNRIRAESVTAPDLRQIRVVGYSLGAVHAAFLKELDSSRRQLNIGRTVLLHPPVSTLNAAANLDRLTPAEIVGKRSATVIKNTHGLEDIMTDYFRKDFNQEWVQRSFMQKLSWPLQLKGITGVVTALFRDTLWDAAFAMRVDEIVGSDFESRRQSARGIYRDVGGSISFNSYVNNMALPKIIQLEGTRDVNLLDQKMGLPAVANRLRLDSQITLMHCADDFVLGAGDLDWLKNQFGPRAWTMPHCGHMGAIWYSPFKNTLLQKLAGQLD